MEAFLFQRVGKNFRTSKFPLLYLKVPGSVPESSRFRTSKFSSRISKFLLNPDQEGDPDRLHSGPNSDVQALKPSALRPEQRLEAFPKLVRYLIGNTNLTGFTWSVLQSSLPLYTALKPHCLTFY